MIHLRLLLSIIVLPATSAELSSVSCLTPTLLTIPSFFSLTSAMHHTLLSQRVTTTGGTSPSVSDTKPDLHFPVESPPHSRCNCALRLVPFVTCLWSTGQLPPLLSLLQRNVSTDLSQPYAHCTCWKWICQECTWLHKQANFIRQVWLNRTSQIGETLKDHIKKIVTLHRHDRKKQVLGIGNHKTCKHLQSFTQTPKDNVKTISSAQSLASTSKEVDLPLAQVPVFNKDINSFKSHSPVHTQESQTQPSVSKKFIKPSHRPGRSGSRRSSDWSHHNRSQKKMDYEWLRVLRSLNSPAYRTASTQERSSTHRCYGDKCKYLVKQTLQFDHKRNSKVKHTAVVIDHDHSNPSPLSDPSGYIRDNTSDVVISLLRLSSNILHRMNSIKLRNNDTYIMDGIVHSESINVPSSSSRIGVNIDSNTEAIMSDTSSFPFVGGMCGRRTNRTCIFKRSTRVTARRKNSHISNVDVEISDDNPSDGSLGRGSLGVSHSNSTNTTNRAGSSTHTGTDNSGVSRFAKGDNRRTISKHDSRKPPGQRNRRQGREQQGQGSRRRGHKKKIRGRRQGRVRRHRDMSLWIDRKQVKILSGYAMEIYAIHNGQVLPYILDPDFENQLPIIPSEVENVNFTWRSGNKRYYYTFDSLYSENEEILRVPVLSVPTDGRVPRRPRGFTLQIQCTGHTFGISTFGIGLLIQTHQGKPLPGTPLRLNLRKECTDPGSNIECDKKCENGGVCDEGGGCQCPEGYLGQYCHTALCYPQCMNGGTCTTPGRCSCPPGYQGRHCEGGICQDKCENGGKCIQKDICACRKGYYGNRCEFSKCVIPCVNGGRCRDVNKCRCPRGFGGDHCEVVLHRGSGAKATLRCSKRCRHGSCQGTTCNCFQGYTGRWCKKRGGRTPRGQRRRVWV